MIELPTITYWLMGSFSKCSYEDLKLIFYSMISSISIFNIYEMENKYIITWRRRSIFFRDKS